MNENERDPYLNDKVCPCTEVTRGDVLMMVMFLGMRHSLTWAAIVDTLKLINRIFSKNVVPDTKYALGKYFPAQMETLKYHLFCPKCLKYLDERSNIQENVTCGCGTTVDVKKTDSFFIEFSLESQLCNLFKNKSVTNALKYRFI